MSRKILVVKNPSGIKRTIEVNKSASLAEVFAAASKQFNLNEDTHELKIGPKTLNLRETIEGSRIPETVVLDIVPKTGFGGKNVRLEVLVRMGFSDEGYLYEDCSEVMDSGRSLWDVVKRLVPSHMAYGDDDVCLAYLGIYYNGKKRLKTVKLEDLCGSERQLFFTCSRNYLQKPYDRAVPGGQTKRTERALKAGSYSISRDSSHRKKQVMEFQKISPEKEHSSESHIYTEPSLGNPNPGVVELGERWGRVYRGEFIGNCKSGEIGEDESIDSFRKVSGDGILVRIVFPKTAVMEGTFSTEETIRDVADFVKKYLVEKAKEFYFYTVQPRLIVGPGVKLGQMKSSPPGTLWCCCKYKSELFRKEILSSLASKVFSYVSTDVPEESKIHLIATSSMSWGTSSAQQ